MDQEPVIYNEYKIYHMGDGFNSTFLFEGHSLYSVTSFTVTKDDTEAFSFTFGRSSIGAATSNLDLSNEDLIDKALNKVKERLDEGDLEDRATYFFECEFGNGQVTFRSVTTPVWSSNHYI